MLLCKAGFCLFFDSQITVKFTPRCYTISSEEHYFDSKKQLLPVFTKEAAGNVAGQDNVGGLIGYIQRDSTLIKNCYSVGFVTGSRNTGGLIAATAPSTAQSSYWDSEASEQASSDSGTPRTTEQMQQQNTFSAWDFTTIWFMNPGYSYPLLRAHIISPIVKNQISVQVHLIGEPLSFTLPPSTFHDPNGLLLTYQASLAGGLPLPPWLAFISSTQTFVGTPLTGAQGVLNIEVRACNLPEQCVTSTFTLTLPNRPPQVQNAILPQTAFNRVPFQFILPEATFFDPDGDRPRLTATSLGGGELLPWLCFNSSTLAFEGTAETTGFLMLTVVATDTFNASVSMHFGLTVSEIAGKYW